MQTCTGGDEPGQAYHVDFLPCNQGTTCMETADAIECVVSPLRPCTQNTCSGDRRVLCGHTGYVKGEEDCMASGRICGQSPSDAACVLTATCPKGNVSHCTADGEAIYAGCDKGYGHPTEIWRCDDGCGTPVCQESASVAYCADAPAIPCGTRTNVCSDDGRRSLFCSQVGGYYTCSSDCAATGKRCMSSTGKCGYDIPCTAKEYSKCSPDGAQTYSCNMEGAYVESIWPCPAGETCRPHTSATGHITAYCE